MAGRALQFSEDRRRYLRAGFVIDERYEIVEHISEGGFGDVYEARDLQLRRPVAVKLLQSQYSKGEKAREQFFEEARILAKIENRHVVQVYGVGMVGARAYIAMQFCGQGWTLFDELRDEERFEVHQAAVVISDVLEALSAAHQQGVVHRDVKPQNILLDGSRGYLTDFGTAKLLSRYKHESLKIAGTAGYMAPEQAMRVKPILGLFGKAELRPADERSDLYAVGTVLYEMLSGCPAFVVTPGMTLQEILSLHLRPPMPLSEVAGWVPDDFAAIVTRAMRINPEDRYDSAGDMLADVRAADNNLYTHEARRRRLEIAKRDPEAAKLLPDTDREIGSVDNAVLPRSAGTRTTGGPQRSSRAARVARRALFGAAAFGIGVAIGAGFRYFRLGTAEAPEAVTEPENPSP